MYFSVRKSIKIANKTYIPCVCYQLPNVLVPTVEMLVRAEKAYIYKEPVSFMNGKVLVKETKAKAKKTARKEASKAKAENVEEPKAENVEEPKAEENEVITEKEVDELTESF